MAKYGPELEPTPPKAKTDGEPPKKTIAETLTDMQAEIKRAADEESKKPGGGNLRSVMNQMKAVAAKSDEMERASAEDRANKLAGQMETIKGSLSGAKK